MGQGERARFGRNLAHTQPTMETMARNNTTAHFCEQCSLYDEACRMATGRGACAAIQLNTEHPYLPLGNPRLYSRRENSGSLSSALSCNFRLVARRQILLCSVGRTLSFDRVVRCCLFHLLCADSYKLVEGECMQDSGFRTRSFTFDAIKCLYSEASA